MSTSGFSSGAACVPGRVVALDLADGGALCGNHTRTSRGLLGGRSVLDLDCTSQLSMLARCKAVIYT